MIKISTLPLVSFLDQPKPKPKKLMPSSYAVNMLVRYSQALEVKRNTDGEVFYLILN